MNTQKSFIVEMAEVIDRHLPRGKAQTESAPKPGRFV